MHVTMHACTTYRHVCMCTRTNAYSLLNKWRRSRKGARRLQMHTCVYMHTYMIHAYMHIYIHAYIHTHINAYTCIIVARTGKVLQTSPETPFTCIHACIHIHTCLYYTCMHAYTYTCTYTCLYHCCTNGGAGPPNEPVDSDIDIELSELMHAYRAHAYTCMHAYIHTCINVCIHTYMYTRTRMHIYYC